VLAVGSHFGGEMVYGKGYLTKVIFASSAKPAVPASSAKPAVPASSAKPAVPASSAEPAVPASGDETAAPVGTDAPAAEADASRNGDSISVADASTVDFRRDVLPILDARCVECHGPDKVKGDLRLDSEAAIFAGDPEWWTVLWGDPDHSLLLERILLPADDPDAMPPNGDRLTVANIDTIRTWIESGGEGGKTAVDGSATAPSPAASAPDVGDAAAITAAADGLRRRGVLAMRIAQNSEDWEVNASLVSPPFTDDDFKLLQGLETVLIQASFNRSQVTDAGLEGLAGFDRLNALRLAQTEIGDGAVDALLRLEGLEILNLYGTRISDAGLSRLVALPNLKRVYCADSAVTPEGVVAAMKNARSGLDVIGPDAAPPAAVGDAESASP
jgi:mono/diheme cytochrome c family protein